MRSSDAVFVGDVIEVHLINGPRHQHRKFIFKVADAVKGNLDTNLEVTTGLGGGDCGYDFKIGHRYIVYASVNSGIYSTGICSGTKPFYPGGEKEIKALLKAGP